MKAWYAHFGHVKKAPVSSISTLQACSESNVMFIVVFGKELEKQTSGHIF